MIAGCRRALGRPAAIAVWCAAWCALVAVPHPALANGRYPAGGQLVVDPGDVAHMVLRTTFGLVQTFDAGVHWSWICERALTPDGFLDPPIIVMTGGRTAAALPDGLALGDRSGCRWTRAPGVANQDVIDVVGSRADPSVAYAAAVVRVNGAFNALVSRTDDGVAWSAAGQPVSDTYPLTIEVAPSRPQRLYLGAQNANLDTGIVAVSDDQGAHWTAHASPGVDAVYVSAVDPANSDRVYLRSFSPEYHLYVSEDGAVSWRLIYQSAVPLTAFALSPDGRSLAVGGAGGLTIIARAEGDGGSSSGSAYVVARTNPLPVTCLTWSAARLLACADEGTTGFTIGASTDSGDSFDPLLRLVDLVPASCPATTATAACATEWCPTATLIGASCSTNSDDAAPGEDAGGRMVSQRPSGCGCQYGTAPDLAPPALAALVITLLVVKRRARRRPPCPLPPSGPLAPVRRGEG